jgi:NRPS condensation-like uncharacterized protein
MTKSRKIGLLLVVILIILVAVVWIEAETHFLQNYISSAVYDNKIIYLCEELPPLSEVERIVEENKEVIRQVESIDPGFISVYIDSSCPGKGSLVIEFHHMQTDCG